MSGQNFPYQTVRDVDVSGRTILLRVDYNVPLNDDGSIADDFRITASLPTIKYLLERAAKIVLISHLGRPKGKPDEKLSLKPVAKDLSEKLGREVKFIPGCIGDIVSVTTKKLSPGQIVLLENLRFHANEEKNDRDFARDLAKDSNANLFVQDGFGVVHRAHASTAAITEFLPSVAGLLLEKEYVEIKSATDDPNRPLLAIMGGAKISDKIPLAKKFVRVADSVAIGGAMANNFLKFRGVNVASSLTEEGQDDTIREIMDEAKEKFGATGSCHSGLDPESSEKNDWILKQVSASPPPAHEFSRINSQNSFYLRQDDNADEKLNQHCQFILPTDIAIAPHGDPNEDRVEINLAENPLYGEAKILDLGTKTIDQICQAIQNSGTVIWNGDLGIDTTPQFSHASSRVALELAKNPHVVSIIGGGDTADFVRNWDTLKGGSFTHVSTGGGASLELMAGDTLPGIAALLPRK